MVEGGPCINPTFNVVDSLVGMTKTHLHTFNMYSLSHACTRTHLYWLMHQSDTTSL